MDLTRDIHEEMIARGFVCDRKRTDELRFTGQFEVRGRPVTVAVAFCDRQLIRIPQLYLLSRKKELPEAVAHIEHGDRVCYVRDEELLLDPLNPRPSVALCMVKMAEALDRIDHLDLSNEVANEFPQHWLGSRVYVDILNANREKAWLYKLRTHDQLSLIADTSPPGYSRSHHRANVVRHHNTNVSNGCGSGDEAIAHYRNRTNKGGTHRRSRTHLSVRAEK